MVRCEPVSGKGSLFGVADDIAPSSSLHVVPPIVIPRLVIPRLVQARPGDLSRHGAGSGPPDAPRDDGGRMMMTAAETAWREIRRDG
jgi:hypothetical protein